MTAPTFALTATEYLAQADRAVGQKARKVLHNSDIPARHRSLIAAEILRRHVTSRRRAILASAAAAERHA